MVVKNENSIEYRKNFSITFITAIMKKKNNLISTQ